VPLTVSNLCLHSEILTSEGDSALFLQITLDTAYTLDTKGLQLHLGGGIVLTQSVDFKSALGSSAELNMCDAHVFRWVLCPKQAAAMDGDRVHGAKEAFQERYHPQALSIKNTLLLLAYPLPRQLDLQACIEDGAEVRQVRLGRTGEPSV
jgi:hypothetical protein